MQSFLEQAAFTLWQKYGEDISTVKVVFPSKRARLFFNEALSKLTTRPLWQPEYLSIDDLMWRLSGVQQADNLRLVAELYKVYSRYHAESFDKFYNWGTILLQDFDTIDKYMVDARKLFVNINDIKDIEHQFGSDSQELEIIRNFWRSFSEEKLHSLEQKTFMAIWQSLADIYDHFRSRLSELGVAYPGMAYRFVAKNVEELYTERNTFCFLGFNALNECEQKLFKYLQKRDDAIFLWDYSKLYTDDPNQEAGLFIRRNIRKFPQSLPIDTDWNRDLKVSVISSPTDVLQCKAVALELAAIFERQKYVDKETAIVLTDENLLQPILNSIPDFVERLNITMGYPVVNTVVYNLLERLLQLQLHKRDSSFYHKDVIGILTHPYINETKPAVAKKLLATLNQAQKIYIDPSALIDFEPVFTPTSTVEELQKYILRVLSEVSDTEDAERREYTYALISNVAKLAETVRNCQIEIDTNTYISLLRQMLQQIRIPYTGEPLGGLQVMGILETRNVDFRNVILVSTNDDNFPGKRGGQSYIPYNLRQGYGLPTMTDAEAMYAYYFYRLIQRAENLTMLYTSAADDKTTGEQSRYIYQLEYESSFKVERSDIALSIPPALQHKIEVAKSPEMIEILKNRSFAPSAINGYITCPMKLYLRYIERIKPAQTIEEEFSKLSLGNVVHAVMELLYKPILGSTTPQELIGAITEFDIQSAVDEAFMQVAPEQMTQSSMRLQINREIICDYVKRYLKYDSQREDSYVIRHLEHEVTCCIGGFNFYGKLDRVDQRADGSFVVVDYKSGQGDKLEFGSIEKLFDPERSDRNSAALQMLIYSTMLAQNEGADVVPALYIGRLMNDDRFSPLLSDSTGNLRCVTAQMQDELRSGLANLMSQIMDPGTPFTQTPFKDRCVYCDYNSVCNG